MERKKSVGFDWLGSKNVNGLQISANRCDAFLRQRCVYIFIILERMECILADKLDIWVKEKNSSAHPSLSGH